MHLTKKYAVITSYYQCQELEQSLSSRLSVTYLSLVLFVSVSSSIISRAFNEHFRSLRSSILSGTRDQSMKEIPTIFTSHLVMRMS
jgi:hypothetical protein